MGIKKPLICQAGSAEAFLDSTATGRELLHGSYYIGIVKLNLKMNRKGSSLPLTLGKKEFTNESTKQKDRILNLEF